MGTVLHLSIRRTHLPLLQPFQSPSRWGRCCIGASLRHRGGLPAVSVPFSMGTVLHLVTLAAWKVGPVVSVPFSMGTVLHPLPPPLQTCTPPWFQSPSRW